MYHVDAHTHRTPSAGTLAVVNLHREAVSLPAEQYLSVGIHPWFVQPDTLEDELARLTRFLDQPSVVAVGECGLDRLSKVPMDLQRTAFTRQLTLARRYGKPVIVHNVRSGSDLLQLRKGLSDPTPWMIHGFHGSLREAELFVQQGCYLGFGRKVLDGSSRAAMACAAVPMERILPETDDTGLSVADIIEAIAVAKKQNPAGVMSALYANFVRFFQIG